MKTLLTSSQGDGRNMSGKKMKIRPPIFCRPSFCQLLLNLVLLAPLAALHAGESPKAQLDSVPFTGGKEGYACYRCPTLAVSAKGTVLAFCEGRVNSHRDEDDMDVVLKRSTDGGRTWGPLQVLANDGRNPCKNQCPVVLPSGRILLVWLWNKWIPSENDRTTREVFVMYSDDDGVTWSKPRNITASVYQPAWKWYGTGPCHAIVKRSEPHKGRIVVPARHNAKGAKTCRMSSTPTTTARRGTSGAAFHDRRPPKARWSN